MTVSELRKALKAKGNVAVRLTLVPGEAPVELRVVKSTLTCALKGQAGLAATFASLEDGTVVLDASSDRVEEEIREARMTELCSES